MLAVGLGVPSSVPLRRLEESPGAVAEVVAGPDRLDALGGGASGGRAGAAVEAAAGEPASVAGEVLGQVLQRPGEPAAAAEGLGLVDRHDVGGEAGVRGLDEPGRDLARLDAGPSRRAAVELSRA